MPPKTNTGNEKTKFTPSWPIGHPRHKPKGQDILGGDTPATPPPDNNTQGEDESTTPSPDNNTQSEDGSTTLPLDDNTQGVDGSTTPPLDNNEQGGNPAAKASSSKVARAIGKKRGRGRPGCEFINLCPGDYEKYH
jgi:hypothetical protein